MEETVFTGMPFWHVDSETENTIKQIKKESKDSSVYDSEKLSEKILNKIIAEKRAKVNLADDLINFSNRFTSFLKKLSQAS